MLYFTHMPGSPQWMDLYQIWFRGPLANIINCAEFCGNRLRGCDSVRGQNLPSTVDLAGRRYCAGAIYRAAFDGTVTLRSHGIRLRLRLGLGSNCGLANDICIRSDGFKRYVVIFNS